MNGWVLGEAFGFATLMAGVFCIIACAVAWLKFRDM